jgi:hypothetical protein
MGGLVFGRITFDVAEIKRISAIVERDGEAALSDDERKLLEDWRAFTRR